MTTRKQPVLRTQKQKQKQKKKNQNKGLVNNYKTSPRIQNIQEHKRKKGTKNDKTKHIQINSKSTPNQLQITSKPHAHNMNHKQKNKKIIKKN